MTKTQRAIRAQMLALTKVGAGWDYVPGSYALTIRKTELVRTPEINRGHGFGQWPDETYHRYLFVTLAARRPIIGDAPAPWMKRQDVETTYWLVQMILDADDPFSVWENRHILADNRKAGKA